MDTLLIPATQEFPFQLDEQGVVWRFSWRYMKWAVARPGLREDGYQMITWKSTHQKREMRFFHRVVWRLWFGEIPAGLEIDHINGIKDDNRIENLRLVTHRQNILYARERLGDWGVKNRKLTDEQRALVFSLPSDSDWKGMAEQWGVHKVTLLNLRVKARKLTQ